MRLRLKYYCNHCDTFFVDDSNGDKDDATVCPHCGVAVCTRFCTMTHPANRPMSTTRAREIISWLGWRDFKKAQYQFATDHPELRPIKRIKK